ncbi:hypothetical protein JCM6882_004313 [Rhodosporidiobolus microsporus]
MDPTAPPPQKLHRSASTERCPSWATGGDSPFLILPPGTTTSTAAAQIAAALRTTARLLEGRLPPALRPPTESAQLRSLLESSSPPSRLLLLNAGEGTFVCYRAPQSPHLQTVEGFVDALAPGVVRAWESRWRDERFSVLRVPSSSLQDASLEGYGHPRTFLADLLWRDLSAPYSPRVVVQVYDSEEEEEGAEAERRTMCAVPSLLLFISVTLSPPSSDLVLKIYLPQSPLAGGSFHPWRAHDLSPSSFPTISTPRWLQNGSYSNPQGDDREATDEEGEEVEFLTAEGVGKMLERVRWGVEVQKQVAEEESAADAAEGGGGRE